MGDSMATKQAYVQVKGLKKHYGDGDARLTVLDGIDTSINRGEICVMLGPSGSGKSTFLNLIGGLEDATPALFWWTAATSPRSSPRPG